MADYREELLLAVSDPEAVFEGRKGEFIAIRRIDLRKHIVVVYREIDPDDGFIITAWRTSKVAKMRRNKQLWP